MNCHQILSGACNAGDRCFSIGSVEGVPFTAYAAGCNIVILASTFERVQIIPGATHGYVKISALDCSTDTGKIAASYENKICIFEPTPILQVEKKFTHLLDYRWVQTGSFLSHSNIITLSWNLEGTRLLTGGTSICLWKEKTFENINNEPSDVKFVIGGGGSDKETKTPISGSVEDFAAWEILWSCQTAIPVYHMAFSPDGTLFATCGRNDRLVKIWYENKQVIFPSKSEGKNNFQDSFDLNYTYVYIAHPRAVTNITWRKTSKYMPKGSVSNMLVTSCLDNICRIWIETVLPDDGLVNMSQFDPLASQNPKFRTHRHKHRFMERLKHMKTCFHIRRNAKTGTYGDPNLSNNMSGPIPSLPSSCSVHDFHSYGFHVTGVSPGMHFHLASSINAETDIPLVPSMHSSDPSNQNCFILHWLNNKEMHFNLQAETILQELTKKVIDEENEVSDLANQNSVSDTSDAPKSKTLKSSKNLSVDDNTDETQKGNNNGINNSMSMSNTTSLNSLINESNPFSIKISDSLDIKIESLLRDWHQSPDLLFAIHPVDGSFLIWVVEWLDDYYPGLFRQAQISFSTRIPSAFPLGDAMSMSTTVSLYNTGFQPMVFREIANVKTKEFENGSDAASKADAKRDSLSSEKDEAENEENEGYKKAESSQKNIDNVKEEIHSLLPNVSPSVSMVTKHSNGSLNLWQLKFSFKTKFTQVLSVGHVSRASGHRFRVNDITCHPVLPLLVSTSHHNIADTEKVSSTNNCDVQNPLNKNIFSPSGFCSELILWKVDSVGPLCHSGGLNELARINSPEISAFSNVAWIPTLLPSTTLGSYSNSPSACFVASDGENLRIYQAVIDARTLLGEISSENLKKFHKSGSFNSVFSNDSSSIKTHKISISEKIKVVSQQSTARPGCIIQLDIISDAKHDWQNTQFLHVFQSQLITGNSSVNKKDATDNKDYHGLLESTLDAMVDLQKSSNFQEPFYIVVIEKTAKGSTIHMWRVIISSKEQTHFLSETALYVPDSNLTQETEDNISRKMSIGGDEFLGHSEMNPELPHIAIKTEKVCTQILPLPDGIDVIHAAPAAGHLSSSSIYPACFAPYILVTACSDNECRFWKCEATESSTAKCQKNENEYVWSEWKMFSKQEESAIDVPGQPLNISAAYSGRIACAYKYGKSFTRPHKGDPNSRYVNLSVAVYECESTGGSEWVLEDTIHLKNIHLPRINIDQRIDLSFLQNNKVIQKKQRINQMLHSLAHDEGRSTRSGETTPESNIKSPNGLLAVPSFSTLQSLRKSIAENGNTCPLTQKHLVQLDWVSKEDGSHILTVAVGSKIMLYTPVSSDIAQANIKAMKESRSVNRPILSKASSLAQTHFVDEIRWMKLRQIDLQTADGLPPLPMQISWVRDGILVVAMDSEMHVYSQWKPKYDHDHSVDDFNDTRNLRDEDLRSIANESAQMLLKSVSSMPLISKVSTANLQLLSIEKKRKMGGTSTNLQSTADGSITDDYMTDLGLFQASRIACPVLPQYHPKQLMELLNSGKIRWVKAILAHLVRCMNGPNTFSNGNNDDSSQRQRSWSRSRKYSISYAVDSNIQSDNKGSSTQIPGELMLDYAEITSIPPLPLWILLNADKETLGIPNLLQEETQDYNQLFEVNSSEENLDDLLDESDQKKFDRRSSLQDKLGISYFGPRQGQMLSRFLTHTHLPGLSSLDQMHLLALADTVATCNSDFSDRFVADATKNSSNKENSGTESLDDCGVRYLLAMKHFMYLLRCLPLNQRAQFQKHGIGTSNIVWAFHSESEEELLNLIPSYTKGDIKWAVLRELGVGYWLKNLSTLRQCVEKLAKCAYQSKQDPLDAAIYYLAMKKKSIVWGLFRSKRDEKMTAFFSNNFNEDRWRKAALKNAFVLLGKQRFDHAVAFFLLANSLNDAIEVCINKLDDFQLALVISRLYEGDAENKLNSTYNKLLCEHILGYDENNTVDISKSHPDPFLRSMTFWILKRYQESLNTLLWNGAGTNHIAFKEEDIFKSESNGTNPNVFNFYIYLRTHPLLVRQNLALTAQEKKLPQVVLSGFSYSGDTPLPSKNEKQLQIEDSITPIERQLYFTTAHRHFKAGCPALALEVLNKLPVKVLDSTLNTEKKNSEDIEKQNLIDTGIFSWEQTSKEKHKNESALDFDWSTPVSKPVDDEFKIEWNDDKADDDNDDHDDIPVNETNKSKIEEDVTVCELQDEVKMDIMAQQLKFVACLKILMEELSTLATGFEVDGGQLRYQLYIWLEKEVEALKQLCNYCLGELNTTNFSQCVDKKDNEISTAYVESEKPTLHEILLQEKSDFEAKVFRAAKRKQWLKENETLLRTLLSYCSLHSASGGGLASIRMELVLLLQELQQEKTQQQLLSPLPFPTTLPLLSACVAGNKTVIADPIKFLQSQTIDMLQSIVNIQSFPSFEHTSQSDIFILRDLAVALSSCIYQSLCDSESFVVKKSEIPSQHNPFENIAKLDSSFECSHLIGNSNMFNTRKRKYSMDETSKICTSPSKWPGVTNLRALLAREKDDDIPKLNILLLESFVATYMALTIYSLANCDSRLLFRLLSHNFSNETWAVLFGGGMKKLLRKATTHSQGSFSNYEDNPEDNSVWNTVTSITKQRVKLNMKILGSLGSSNNSNHMKEDKPTYREQFVPPEMSMLSYFLLKPNNLDDDDYDTDNEEYESENEDDDLDDDEIKKKKENVEHINPNSFAWCILKTAIVKLLSQRIRDFINVAGIEIQDLPVLSPITHEVLRTIGRWEDYAVSVLAAKGQPPSNFIPGCYIESGISGVAIHKYRSILNKENTPYITHSSAAPVRRLWNYLVRQEYVQDIFIKAIFLNRNDNASSLKKTSNDGMEEGNDSKDANQSELIRIIHKDPETIQAFCLNNSSTSIIAIANPKEIIELDISLLLDSPNWFEDECDYDLLNLSKDGESTPNSGFLVVQSTEQANNNSNTTMDFGTNYCSQLGRGTTLVLKHRVDNVKKMCSHPLMPLYMTGGQDGSVQIWEWGHKQVVSTPRPSGTFAKVTRCRFSDQGNKFGIGDGDGKLSLWQAAIATQNTRPFHTYQCHNKVLSDFIFLGSCSLIATVGQSSENKNISIWDTLLPQKKACISAFTCHDQGASCVVFAPQHQILISCGKKGDICVFDMRQRVLKHRFVAHENAIRCIAIDPYEEFFATGSVEGDVKIWDFNQFNNLNTFNGEHAKNSFFKHMGQGVNQIHIDSFGRLFTCGTDGCVKIRQLIEKDPIVHSLY